MSLRHSSRSRTVTSQDGSMMSGRVLKSEESVLGRSVLSEGRPNSRDREPRRGGAKVSEVKGHDQAQSQKRPVPVPSPTSKENSEGVPPATKRRKTPPAEENNAPAEVPSTRLRRSQNASLSLIPAKSIRFERSVPSAAESGSSSSDSESDSDADAATQSEAGDDTITVDEQRRRQRLSLRKELRRSNTVVDEPRSGGADTVPASPTPHKALLYYQERLNGNLEVEPCSGVIKKVRLFNFMCHERFEKEWNTNLNFITGENGSGKSAILSGIIIGLGARANTTSRTKSVTELVKTGKDFAKIEVTLVNHGLLSEEKYGREVTIQRIIDSRGPSAYKVHTGLSNKFRVLRRTELDFILFNLGIMVDNPVAVLNQEAARSFLKTKDPGDKYKFFFEGSSLAQFDRILRETRRNMEDTEQNLVRSKGVVDDRQEEVLKYKKLKLKLEEAERMEEEMERLTIEHRWSLVIVEEGKREDARTELEREEDNKAKVNDGLDTFLVKKAELMNNSSTNPEEIDGLKLKLQKMGKEEQDVQRETTTLTRQSNESKAKVRSAGGQISSLTRTLADIEVKIRDMSSRGKEEAESAKREYEEKLGALEAEKEEYEAEYTTLKSEKQQFNHGTEALRSEVQELQAKEREFKTRIVKLKDEVRNLEGKSSRVNRYAAFGRSMEDLMAKITANQHRFKVPPRGPLGACFTVKNEKYVRLIEMILNSQLFDFVVENDKDQHLLNQLIKQSFSNRQSMGVNDSFVSAGGRKPAVICNRAAFTKVFDTTRTKATVPNAPTILDVIEVEGGDTAVLNTLLDACQIERILLFQSNKDACELLKDKRNPGFPHNCKVGYSLEFYQISPDPRYRLETRNQNHRNMYLKCSSALQVKHLKQEILTAEASLEELGPALEAKRREEAIIRQEYNSQEAAFKEVQKKVREVTMKIMMHQKTTTKEPDISSFVEEREDTKAQLEAQVKGKEAAETALEAIRSKLEVLKSRKEELTQDIEATQERIREKKDLMDNYQANLAQIEAKIRTAKLKLRDIQGRCDLIKPKLERYEKSVEGKTAEAEESGPRIETQRSPTSLLEEVRDYNQRVKEAKRLVGDRETILRDLARAKERHRNLKAEYKCWVEVFQLMQTYVNTNVDYYESMIQIIGNVLITSFQCLIASRGYKGRLLIDHEQKELYYFVCPDGKANEKTLAVLHSKDNKTIKHYLTEYGNGLSGGERSFATICYILSMWQIMECPFFMLDEFDVFMDPFNRKASQNALISHANRFKAHQFFLFTPLDITELAENSTASVLKMFPPLRNDVVANEEAPEDVEEEEDSDEAGGKRRRRGGASRPLAEPSTNQNRRTRRR